VRAHQQVGFGRLHEERVLHFAGRVVRLEVQGVEVEPFGFHLGTLGDFPAHAHEDVRHAVLQRGQRVAGSGPTTARGCRDVNGLLDQDAGVVLGFELSGAVRERLVNTSARRTHQLSGGGLLVLGQASDPTVGQAERRLLTGVGQADCLQFIERGRAGNGGDGLVHGGVDGGFIQRVRDGGARQSFSHLLFLATSRVMPVNGAAAPVSRQRVRRWHVIAESRPRTSSKDAIQRQGQARRRVAGRHCSQSK
jgi:hypothetical protein